MQDNSSTGKWAVFKQYPARFFSYSARFVITHLAHGLIIIIPLVLTIWVLGWAFNLVDQILNPLLTWTIGRSIPGLGFIIIITSVILIGYFGKQFGHRRIFDFFESQVTKMPVIGAIYGSTRQILTSLTANPHEKFLEVIFMEFPRNGTFTVGLVTSKVQDSQGHSILNVFIPTAPNPTSGFLQIVPESDVVKTTMSVNEAMKLIISAGKVSREDIGDMLSQVHEPASKKKVLKA